MENDVTIVFCFIKNTNYYCHKKNFGETGRSLNTRISEHKRDVKYANENNAIFLHYKDFNHTANWQNSKVIFKSNNYKKRRLLESALINTFPNMNTSHGSFQLNPVINNILIKPHRHKI